MYRNNVQLIGFTGKDAELKKTNDGREFVRFSMATKESWKNRDGEYESRVTWHNIVVWTGLNKFARNLKGGEHIFLEGTLNMRDYEKEVTVAGKTSTVKVSIAEISALSIRRLDRKKQDDAAEPEDTDNAAVNTDDVPF